MQVSGKTRINNIPRDLKHTVVSTEYVYKLFINLFVHKIDHSLSNL